MLIFRIFFTLVFFIFSSSIFGAEDFLTLKQQLDRLQREVNDLSKSVFRNDISSGNINEANEVSNISAFDMRIYDLEKDIKNLNSNFEEMVFQLDEIKRLYEEMNIKLDEIIINKKVNQEITQDTLSNDNSIQADDNTLGTLKINSEDLSENIEDEIDAANIDSQNEILNLTPDEQFQIAFDLLRAQKFDQAESSLKTFLEKNSENNLSGTAHYWLGEIYLLRKQHHEAALIFAEGYQKYPDSIKAPDNLYKLADSLVKIDKISEACNTLKKFEKEHPNHKLISKSDKMIKDLECLQSVE